MEGVFDMAESVVWFQESVRRMLSAIQQLLVDRLEDEVGDNGSCVVSFYAVSRSGQLNIPSRQTHRTV
jgi:hypothetical protein